MTLATRPLSLLALLLAHVALPAAADTVLAKSRVTGVTVYPEGAEVTREIRFDAPAGQSELLITDLPAVTDAAVLRLTPGDGLQLGAYAMRTDRLPPRDDAETPEQAAARAAVEAAEAALRKAEAVVKVIRAKVESADAQAGFLRGLSGPLPATATADSLQAMGQAVASGVLAARQAALAAEAELPPAEAAVAEAQQALDKARAAADALSTGDSDYAALSIAISSDKGGPAQLSVTQMVSLASWRPIYDMRLTRKDGPALVIDRGVMVSQQTGEDWAGVTLTLSTAQPSDNPEPGTLFPELRRITPDEPDMPMAKSSSDMEFAEGAMAEPVMEPAMVEAPAQKMGDFVVYNYPATVDVASGVEDLRLSLDSLTLTPKIEARAIPRLDATAFAMASFTNTSGEILLPGVAVLYRDGVLVGGTYIDSIAPGAEGALPFGAIQTLRLTRDMPTRAEGDRGLLTRTTRIEETAVLTVENLGDESWPVRLMDQVPYSEQEDLAITLTADPAPSEADVKGQRGILAWDFDLAAGERRDVTLTHVLTWPEGQILQ